MLHEYLTSTFVEDEIQITDEKLEQINNLEELLFLGLSGAFSQSKASNFKSLIQFLQSNKNSVIATFMGCNDYIPRSISDYKGSFRGLFLIHTIILESYKGLMSTSLFETRVELLGQLLSAFNICLSRTPINVPAVAIFISDRLILKNLMEIIAEEHKFVTCKMKLDSLNLIHNVFKTHEYAAIS